MIDTLIFDLDGTLLNTLDDLTICTNKILMDYGFNSVTNDDMKHFIGNGAINQIKKASKLEEDDPRLFEMIEKYKNYYEKNCLNNTKPYEGVLDMIKTLKSNGYKMAIVSNKPHESVVKLSDLYFNDIDVAIGVSDGLNRKPSPDMVVAAAKTLNSSIVNCIYIGDSEVDIATAKNAKIDCLSVTWGFRTKDELISSGASKMFDNVQSLLSHLISLNHNA